MATNQIYLDDKQQAKMVYIQEQKNQGLPMTEQKTVNQIMKEWVLQRLALEDVKPQIEQLSKEG